MKEMLKSVIYISERTVWHMHLLLLCCCYQQEHHICWSGTPGYPLVHWADGRGSTMYLQTMRPRYLCKQFTDKQLFPIAYVL